MADEELILVEELIPAERPPDNTREVFLNPPDWRYQAACAYLDEEKRGKAGGDEVEYAEGGVRFHDREGREANQ